MVDTNNSITYTGSRKSERAPRSTLAIDSVIDEEMVEALEQADTEEAREAAEQMIQEDPLEITVRSGWYAPGADTQEQKPEEYNILLGTGGPATRIIGKLSDYGEPEAARLEVQDWFKPWTEYQGTKEAVLLTYARQFYFGD